MVLKPENFDLDTRVDQYALDHEVAARIANTLFQADPETQRGGNNRVSEHVVIDPSGETKTLAVIFTDQDNPEDDKGYRVSFDASESEDVNQAYAKEMRHAFLDAERRNRTGLAGTLAMSAIIAAIPEGFGVAMASAPHTTGNGKAEIFAASTFGAVAFLHQVGVPKHLIRLNIVKPDALMNKRHLNAAAKVAKKLKLPPVVLAT